MKITAAILTKNSQDTVGKLIDSISFFDEIVVVDDFSTDRTKAICEKRKVNFFANKLADNFAKQRNYALKKSKNNWVFFIDDDEKISNKLKSELLNLIKKESVNVSGFYIKRRDFFWGKKIRHSKTATAKIVRLADKNKGVWKRAVHEYWDIRGKKNVLKGEIIHTHPKTITQFIERLNKYTSIHAVENRAEGKKATIFKIIVFPVYKFIDNYILKMGFLDGSRGFVTSLLEAMHSYLAWSKLWLLQKKV